MSSVTEVFDPDRHNFGNAASDARDRLLEPFQAPSNASREEPHFEPDGENVFWNPWLNSAIEDEDYPMGDPEGEDAPGPAAICDHALLVASLREVTQNIDALNHALTPSST
ncbi:hypothetical protein EST38_g12007 [Candolleomyces aberdarensis]|uniref:Uncharacterized protein n=1 Tax=Candolleomyces aberdarensis TaxID=2316362 RepID=A0A4Q2D456_9AGAR|nr:hypothetical protein EST38_g12007 [Candolleomyces aberdarensis]